MSAVTKFQIPAKPPKYFDALHQYIDTASPFASRESTKFTFDSISSNWAPFREKHRKLPVVKTAQEKETAKVEKLGKLFTNTENLERIKRCRDIAPELKHAASAQQQLLQSNIPNSKRRKTSVRDDDDEEEAEAEEEEEDEQEADDVEEEQQQEEEEEEEESTGKDDVEEEEQEEKNIRLKDQKLTPVKEKRQRRQVLKEKLHDQQTTTVDKLETMKKTFFHSLNANSIPWDEEMARVFDELYKIAVEQKTIIDSATQVIDESDEE